MNVAREGAPPMPPGQSKVELYAALRRDAREGMSNRALERKYRVGGGLFRRR